MQRVQIKNQTCSQAPPLSAVYCASFLCRLRGLTFRRSLPPDQGLLLVQSRDSRMDSSIHMLAVWMSLGIVWINNAGEVVDTCLARPWRLAYFPHKPARYVLEIHPRRLQDFHLGDHILFEEV